MAKDRTMPCEAYESIGVCKKGRKAEHTGYCQRCDKYRPRAKVIIKNRKSIKLDRIKAKEFKREKY